MKKSSFALAFGFAWAISNATLVLANQSADSAAKVAQTTQATDTGIAAPATIQPQPIGMGNAQVLADRAQQSINDRLLRMEEWRNTVQNSIDASAISLSASITVAQWIGVALGLAGLVL